MTNDASIRRYTADEIRHMRGRTDWDHLAKAEDHEGPAEIDVDWSRVEVVEPGPKELISLRVDSDVMAFFRAQGKGYQTRMNAILRSYMQSQAHR